MKKELPKGFTRSNFVKQNLRGFTLVELLITISIIAVLSVIGFVIYTSVLKQGRDSKRQADLRSIQAALEQYNNDQGYYPVWNSIGSTCANGVFEFGCPLKNSAGTKTYMDNVPLDPNPSRIYDYYSIMVDGNPCAANIATCGSYCLSANFDINPNMTRPSVCTNGSYNFVIIPP